MGTVEYSKDTVLRLGLVTMSQAYANRNTCPTQETFGPIVHHNFLVTGPNDKGPKDVLIARLHVNWKNDLQEDSARGVVTCSCSVNTCLVMAPFHACNCSEILVTHHIFSKMTYSQPLS
jgi:hypothetical protein